MCLGLGGVVGLQGAYKAEWKKKHCKNIHDFIRISRKHIVCVYAICICGAFFSRDVSFFFGVVGSRTEHRLIWPVHTNQLITVLLI